MQWEYTMTLGTTGEPGGLLNELNQLGAEDWEAVAVIEAGQHQTVLLKRQKKASPEAKPPKK